MDFVTYLPRIAYLVGTFSGCADDLHTGGILQVVHTRDCTVTWSASLYSIGSGSQVYSSILEEFPESHGDTVEDEYSFSSTDWRSVRENYTGVRGHVESMCPRSQG